VEVRKSDLAADAWTHGWDDPDGIARYDAARRAALLHNPASESDDDVVSLVGLAGRRVIGRFDAINGRLRLDGTEVPVVWGSSLFVAPEFRAGGMGLRLMLRFQALAPTVAVCGISQAVHPIYQKLRWTEFQMPRFVLVRRSRAFLESVLGAHAASRAAAAMVDAGLAIHRRLRADRRGATIERLDAAPQAWQDWLSAPA